MSRLPSLRDLFIASFNADLAQLDCAARVASEPAHPADRIALHDPDGRFIGTLPIDASPATVVAAFDLYRIGLSRGVHNGARAVWASLTAPPDAVARKH